MHVCIYYKSVIALLVSVVVGSPFWNCDKVEAAAAAAAGPARRGVFLDKTTPSGFRRRRSKPAKMDDDNNEIGKEEQQQQQKQRECDVRDLTAIVVGAGPSGLATSLALSNVCKKVLLVEKHPTFEKRGATFGMALNGQKCLNEIRPGLLEYMNQIGLRQQQPGSLVEQNKTLVFVWWEMRDAFLEYVQKTDNIELHCGEEFIDIVDDEEDSSSSVCVTFKSGLQLKGDFVVGADGVHSKVRQHLNLPPVIQSQNTLFRGSLEVDFDDETSCSQELRLLFEGGDIVPFYVFAGGPLYFVLFNFHSKHPGRLAWIFSTSIDVPADISGSSSDSDAVTPYSIARQHVKDPKQLQLLEEILDLTNEDNLKPYPKTCVVDLSDETLQKEKQSLSNGRRWGGRGRITLVGDAAHAMRPSDGYGGSMALEDAIVLARCIIGEDAVLYSDDSPTKSLIVSRMLQKFEESRLPRVKKVYDNQETRYQTRMKEGKSPGLQSEEFLDWLYNGV